MKNINSITILFFILCLLFATTCKKNEPVPHEPEEPPVESGTTGKLTWTLSSDGILTISGKGEMPNYDYPPPWKKYLITTVIIKNGVTSIGDRAFYGCTGLASVTIPNSVTSIGNYAFGFCSSLTSISIPNSVTNIGNDAFSYCSSLTSVTIPNSVTFIGFSAFRVCLGLISIDVDKDNPAYSSEEGVLFNKTKTLLIRYPAGRTGTDTYTIPNSVTDIGYSAFQGCISLTSVTIPNLVTSIGSGAFSGCTGLISITIPNSVTSIGDYAFVGCTSLKSVTIPNSVTSIGRSAFATGYGLSVVNFNAINCTYMGEISFPVFGFANYFSVLNIGNVVKTIPDNAFYSCHGLTSVIIPNSVTSIGENSFAGCYYLKSVIIPNSVTSIGNYAFSGSFNLTEIINESATPQTIEEDVFISVVKSACTLRVPAASLEAYRSAEGWKDFENIVAI